MAAFKPILVDYKNTTWIMLTQCQIIRQQSVKRHKQLVAEMLLVWTCSYCRLCYLCRWFCRLGKEGFSYRIVKNTQMYCIYKFSTQKNYSFYKKFLKFRKFRPLIFLQSIFFLTKKAECVFIARYDMITIKFDVSILNYTCWQQSSLPCFREFP